MTRNNRVSKLERRDTGRPAPGRAVLVVWALEDGGYKDAAGTYYPDMTQLHALGVDIRVIHGGEIGELPTDFIRITEHEV